MAGCEYVQIIPSYPKYYFIEMMCPCFIRLPLPRSMPDREILCHHDKFHTEGTVIAIGTLLTRKISTSMQVECTPVCIHTDAFSPSIMYLFT